METFNCKDMSYSVATFLYNLGIDARVVHGYPYNESIGHCWISVYGVYFDAVSLWFNDEHKYPEINYIDKYPWATFYPNGTFLDVYQGA